MSIETFRKTFSGVKANRFLIVGSFPSKIDTNIKEDESTEFYVKASQFPGSSIGVVSLNYRGRPLKFSAEKAHSDWVMQIYSSNKSSYDLRKAFQSWMDAMNSSSHLTMDYELTSNWAIYYNQDLKSNTWVQNALMINCFPVDISPIELTNDTPDVFAEFTVTMTYDACQFTL